MRKKIKNIIKLRESLIFHKSTGISSFPKTSGRQKKEWTTIQYKSYPRLKRIPLMKKKRPKKSLLRAIVDRNSIRKYFKTHIEKSTLSGLLYYSSGIKAIENKSINNDFRFYPSAGARYPLEIYPVILKSKAINPSIYHYHVKSHSLELLLEPPYKKEFYKNFNQPFLKNSSVILIVTAVVSRTLNKYGERGYRHILTEYGHLAQNIYLLANSLGIGACSIGGFNDEGLAKLLDIDIENEIVVGAISLG